MQVLARSELKYSMPAKLSTFLEKNVVQCIAFFTRTRVLQALHILHLYSVTKDPILAAIQDLVLSEFILADRKSVV